MASKKGEQADRVTILIEKNVNTKLQHNLAKNIMDGTKHPDDKASTSFSRVLNDAIKEAFEKGIDKNV